MRSPRLAAAGILAAVAALALLLAPSGTPPASAGLVDATCTQTATLVFAPGLGLTPKATDWSGTGEFNACVSGAVVRGDYTVGGSGQISCLGGSADADVLVDWITPSGGTARSRIHFTVDLAVGPNGGLSATLDGVVTEGLFEGDKYRGAFASIAVNPLDCLTRAGARTGTGAGTAAFLPS